MNTVEHQIRVLDEHLNDKLEEFVGSGKNIAELKKEYEDLQTATAPIENDTISTHAYSVGEFILFNGQLCEVTQAISVGTTLAIGTNLRGSTTGEEIEDLKKSTSDFTPATSSTPGTSGLVPAPSIKTGVPKTLTEDGWAVNDADHLAYDTGRLSAYMPLYQDFVVGTDGTLTTATGTVDDFNYSSYLTVTWEDMTEDDAIKAVMISGTYAGNFGVLPGTDSLVIYFEDVPTTGDTVRVYKIRGVEDPNSTTPGSGVSITAGMVAGSIANVENGQTATRAYAVGELVYYNGTLYQAILPIAANDAFAVGTNIEEKTVGELVSNLSSAISDINATIGTVPAGKTVQGQIDDLKSDLNIFDAIIPNTMRETESYDPSWVQGGIETNGEDSATVSSGRIKTDFIPVGKECFLSATTNGTILYAIRIYDSNKEHLSNGYANDDFGTIIVSSGFTKYSINVDSVKAVEPTAGYIRVVARKADYTALTPSDNGMTSTYKGQIDTSETLADVFVSKKNNGKYFAEEISFTYDIDISGHYTKGFLKLPPNYPNVAKVPMIVFVHGSADIMNLSATKMTTSYETYYNYLRDCGYAIFDCYGWGDKYTVNYGSTWGTPTNNLCYLNGIEYVCNNYNIDRRNIFVSCKSLGGIEAYSLCYQNIVPIKAAGLLAPELDIFGPKPFGYHRDQRVAIATDDGFTGDWQSVIDVADESFSQDALKAYMLTQGDTMQKHNPAWKNLILAELDKFNLSLNNDYTVSGYKVTDVPMKAWAAEDDDAVSYDKIVYHMTQIRNAGGCAEVRTMPNNTGKHHSVDYDPNALQTTNVTTPLGIEYATIPTAYYELEQFFNQFLTI